MNPAVEYQLTQTIQNLSDKDFIESFFFLVNKKRQEVPFILNRAQNQLEQNWGEWNVVLKARKLGVSILVDSGKFLSRVLRKMNRNCVILSFDKEATQRALERTDWTLGHLPFKIKPERESVNEFKIQETNSKIFIGVAGSKAFGRGDDITDLHLMEYAWFENPQVLTGLLEALVPGAFVVVESTANGPSNEFAKLYWKGRRGGSKWKSHFLGWTMDEELTAPIPADFSHTEEEKLLKATLGLTDGQLAWRRQKIVDMPEPELFPQEYPLNDKEAFVVLGNCVFNKRALMNYESIVSYPETVGYLSAA